MTDSYNVGYSVDALGDLREIYSYIANELLVPEAAAAQLGRIRKEVRSLDFMPARYTLVEWEPWHGHADRIDVIDVIEELQSAKGVALHLRIVLSGYEDSKTVFVVNYMHGAVADENGIRSSEALFYPTGEVHSLFNQNNRVGASLLGLFQKLHDEADIPGGTVIHFSVIPAEILGRICSFHAECFTELVLTKRVGIGAFCSIVAAFILVSFAEPC